MKEVHISSSSTHMLPPHIRQLSVRQQEAITQFHVQETKDSLTVFVGWMILFFVLFKVLSQKHIY